MVYSIKNDGSGVRETGPAVSVSCYFSYPAGTFNDVIAQNLQDSQGKPKVSLMQEDIEKFYADVEKRADKAKSIIGQPSLFNEKEVSEIASLFGIDPDKISGLRYSDDSLVLHTTVWTGIDYVIQQDGSAIELTPGSGVAKILEKEIAPKGTYSQLMQNVHQRYLARLYEKPVIPAA